MELLWNIYEVESSKNQLHGIKLRGTIRKFTIENNINCLVENASDKENVVRFALLEEKNLESLLSFINKLIPDAKITLVLNSIPNPVLSKVKVNDLNRY